MKKFFLLISRVYIVPRGTKTFSFAILPALLIYFNFHDYHFSKCFSIQGNFLWFAFALIIGFKNPYVNDETFDNL